MRRGGGGGGGGAGRGDRDGDAGAHEALDGGVRRGREEHGAGERGRDVDAEAVLARRQRRRRLVVYRLEARPVPPRLRRRRRPPPVGTHRVVAGRAVAKQVAHVGAVDKAVGANLEHAGAAARSSGDEADEDLVANEGGEDRKGGGGTRGRADLKAACRVGEGGAGYEGGLDMPVGGGEGHDGENIGDEGGVGAAIGDLHHHGVLAARSQLCAVNGQQSFEVVRPVEIHGWRQDCFAALIGALAEAVVCRGRTDAGACGEEDSCHAWSYHLLWDSPHDEG